MADVRVSRQIGRVCMAAVLVCTTVFAVPATAGAADLGDVTINFDRQPPVEIDVDEVTVLVRWVGAGIDRGPAAQDDPMFDGLPAGYALDPTPSVEQVETSVTEVSEETREIDSSPFVIDVDFIGDPENPGTWVSLGDDIYVTVTTRTTITRTHHITETRTFTVVHDDAGTPPSTIPSTPGTGVGPGDPVPEGTLPGDPAPSTTVPSPTVPAGPDTSQGTLPTDHGTPSSTVDAATATAPAGATPATAVVARPAYAG